MNSICFDIGGTFVKYGVFNEQADLIETGKFETEKQDAAIFFQSLVKKINDLESRHKASNIGLSFPGFINYKTGEAILAGALTYLHGVNIKEELQKYLGDNKKDIVIDNDANCAALAEKHSGNAQESGDFFLLTIGTGIGGAIMVNDQLVRGYNYRAGEFGMMITDYTTKQYTTAHDLASMRALVNRYKEIYQISQSTISGEVLFDDQRQETKELIKSWGKYLSLLIFNTTVTLNPQKVLIGGGVSQNKSLLPLINSCLEEIPSWKDFKVPLEICFYQNNAGLYGAYYLLKNKEEEK